MKSILHPRPAISIRFSATLQKREAVQLSSQPRSLAMASQKPHFQLILDFDGTITKADTTAVIGARCIAKARELAPAGMPENDLPKSMDFYSGKYFQEYREWRTSFVWPYGKRTTVDEEVSYLAQSKAIEQDSFLRVRNAVLDTPGGILNMEHDGRLRNDFMMDAGRQAIRSGEVQMRDPDGLRRLIAKANKDGNRWGIVSVSFSRRFILGALIEAGLVKESQADDVASKIRCNELLAPPYYNEESRLIILCSAWDKQDAFQGLLAKWEDEQGTHGRTYPVSSKDQDATITIYAGDSSTDLGCLAGPAIGVYVSEAPKDDPFGHTLEKLRIECLPIDELPERNVAFRFIERMDKLKAEGKPPHLIYRATDFQALADWIENAT